MQVENADKAAREMLDLLNEEFYQQGESMLLIARRYLEQHKPDFLLST